MTHRLYFLRFELRGRSWEGEAPSEPAQALGSHGGSPSRNVSGPPARGIFALSIACLVLASSGVAFGAQGEPASFERSAIFPVNSKHNHASCVVETQGWQPAGGLVCRQRRADGRRRGHRGARLAQGKNAWGPKFLMADTPGYPGLQPGPLRRARWIALAVLADDPRPPLGRGTPQVSPAANTPTARPRRLNWSGSGVLHVTPKDFAAEMRAGDRGLERREEKARYRSDAGTDRSARSPTSSISGWAGCRGCIRWCCRPGRWILPLYSDTFVASIMAISDDRGATWTASKPLIGFGNIQPSLVRKNDGELVAFMRDNGPHHKSG